MSDIRKMLRTIRVREGLDQAELAAKLGVSRSAVANWETGRAQIAEGHKAKITELFPDITSEAVMPRVTRHKWQIREWGSISAGDGQGNAAPPDFSETYIPADFDRDDFGAMTVQGDSMMDFLYPSDLVIFRDWKQEKIGHAMAAQLPDGEWVVKVLVYEGGRFWLRSCNPKYPDIAMEDVRLAGYLVGIIRDDGDERIIRLNSKGLKPDVKFFERK